MAYHLENPRRFCDWVGMPVSKRKLDCTSSETPKDRNTTQLLFLKDTSTLCNQKRKLWVYQGERSWKCFLNWFEHPTMFPIWSNVGQAWSTFLPYFTKVWVWSINLWSSYLMRGGGKCLWYQDTGRKIRRKHSSQNDINLLLCQPNVFYGWHFYFIPLTKP